MAVPITPAIIAENANSPMKAMVDGQSAEQFPIDQQILAANYNAASPTPTDVPASGWRGVRMARVVPPGAAPC